MKSAKLLLSIVGIIIGFFITGFTVHGQIMADIDEKMATNNELSKERVENIEKLLNIMNKGVGERFETLESQNAQIQQDIKNILIAMRKGS